MKDMYDVTIIGGGTTGMYSAFYSGMRDMKTKVIEYQPTLGGKVSFFYPEKKIYDVGGLPGVSGEDLVSNVEEQALNVEPTLVTGEKIVSIEKVEDGSFVLTTLNGTEHYSKTVIVATGLGTFNMQSLQVEDGHWYEGKHLHYTIQNLKQYTGKKTVVVSENRVGIDWALALENVAEDVHLVNRGDQFKAVYENDVEKLEASTVHVHMNTTIENLNGDQHTLNGVELSNEESLAVDHVLVYEGLQIEKSIYQQWGLETEKGRIPVGTDMCSNIEGIFVAGDATIYPGKTMLIGSGFTEAMAAVNSVKSYLDPKAKSQVYSTVIYKYADK